MNKEKIKKVQRLRRKLRVKAKGNAQCPRLSVKRSLVGIYTQLIDDVAIKTLVSASSKEIKEKGLDKTKTASLVGKLLAEKAVAKGIKKVVFDKGSYKYHGRVKALADGAREGGLQF